MNNKLNLPQNTLNYITRCSDLIFFKILLNYKCSAAIGVGFVMFQRYTHNFNYPYIIFYDRLLK